MYLITFFIILSSLSLTECADTLITAPLETITSQSKQSFVPQYAGIALVGCMALYSFHTFNENAIKLTTLCGALVSGYILYKHINTQEEIKELVVEATDHITKNMYDSETRINNNVQTTSHQIQQQIFKNHADFTNFQSEVNKKMDASLAEQREQFLTVQKQSDLNLVKLEHDIQTASNQLEQRLAEHNLDITTNINQKHQELDKRLEDTNLMLTQLHNIFVEIAHTQSIKLPAHKHSFTSQPTTHKITRSLSSPDINNMKKPLFTTKHKQTIDQKFEQQKKTLQQNYEQQQEQVMRTYNEKEALLTQQVSLEASYKHSTLTEPIPLTQPQTTFQTPEATSFTPKKNFSTPNTSNISRLFTLFDFFTR